MILAIKRRSLSNFPLMRVIVIFFVAIFWNIVKNAKVLFRAGFTFACQTRD